MTFDEWWVGYPDKNPSYRGGPPTEARAAWDAAVERCAAVCAKLQAECVRDSEEEVFAWNRLNRAIAAIREGA